MEIQGFNRSGSWSNNMSLGSAGGAGNGSREGSRECEGSGEGSIHLPAGNQEGRGKGGCGSECNGGVVNSHCQSYGQTLANCMHNSASSAAAAAAAATATAVSEAEDLDDANVAQAYAHTHPREEERVFKLDCSSSAFAPYCQSQSPVRVALNEPQVRK